MLINGVSKVLQKCLNIMQKHIVKRIVKNENSYKNDGVNKN